MRNRTGTVPCQVCVAHPFRRGEVEGHHRGASISIIIVWNIASWVVPCHPGSFLSLGQAPRYVVFVYSLKHEWLAVEWIAIEPPTVPVSLNGFFFCLEGCTNVFLPVVPAWFGPETKSMMNEPTEIPKGFVVSPPASEDDSTTSSCHDFIQTCSGCFFWQLWGVHGVHHFGQGTSILNNRRQFWSLSICTNIIVSVGCRIFLASQLRFLSPIPSLLSWPPILKHFWINYQLRVG